MLDEHNEVPFENNQLMSLESSSSTGNLSQVEDEEVQSETSQVAKAKGPNMTKSLSFVLIMKFFYEMHDDVDMKFILKLQILNKKCYDTLIPMVMSQL